MNVDNNSLEETKMAEQTAKEKSETVLLIEKLDEGAGIIGDLGQRVRKAAVLLAQAHAHEQSARELRLQLDLALGELAEARAQKRPVVTKVGLEPGDVLEMIDKHFDDARRSAAFVLVPEVAEVMDRMLDEIRKRIAADLDDVIPF